MNRDKVYLKGYVIGRAVDTLGYQGLMVQLENLDVVEIDKNLVHKDINEPQKKVVPQFVADWIEVCKEHLPISLHTAMNPNFMKQNNQSSDLMLWIEKSSNQEIFAQAWIFGYTVEEEKQYTVKMKNLRALFCYLAYIPDEGYWSLMASGGESIIIKHTRKELEEAGFGWVFNCEGVEIEEVEE